MRRVLAGDEANRAGFCRAAKNNGSVFGVRLSGLFSLGSGPVAEFAIGSYAEALAREEGEGLGEMGSPRYPGAA